jgi:hypothetical protein
VTVEKNNVPVITTGNIYIPVDRDYQNGDYQNGEAEALIEAVVSPVGEVIEALPYCQSAEDLRLIAEGYPVEVMGDAIALQDTQWRRQQLQRWWESAQSSLISKESLSDRLSQCINIPSFRQIMEGSSLEQIRSAIQGLPAVDRERLSCYWREVRRQDEVKANSHAQMLLTALQEGIEAFKGVLGRLGIVERWKSIERLEIMAPEEMMRLMQVAPEWPQWCG